MFLNPVNLVFFTLMGVFALVDIISWFRGRHLDFRGIIVSLGVLGTFVGIFLGLQDFDTNNIQSSIPGILEGMKTAFITSIVGMSLSILLSALLRAPTQDKAPLPAHAPLDGEALIDAIRSEAASTRSTLEEGFSTQQRVMQETLHKLGEGASREIVEALQEVVREFNRNLTEQFGENFKELNEAVGKLLAWQENHKDLVDADRKLVEQANASIRAMAEGLQALKEWQTQLQQALDQAAPALSGLAQQSQTLDTQLKQFTDTAEAAREVMARLEHSSEQVAQGLETQSEALERLTGEVTRQLPASLGALENTLVGLSERFARDYEAFLQHYRRLSER